MKILFTTDCNGFESKNPKAFLVECVDTNLENLRKLELSQIRVGRRGGMWKEIMIDGNLNYTLISQGNKSDYTSGYDLEYKLISGNY